MHRAQSTAECKIGSRTDRAMAVAAPVTLRRSVSCALDNAVRAAGADGRVVVEVPSNTSDIAIRVLDDGPGLGNVPTNNSLGLTITRALVSACGGAFELKPGAKAAWSRRSSCQPSAPRGWPPQRPSLSRDVPAQPRELTPVLGPPAKTGKSSTR